MNNLVHQIELEHFNKFLLQKEREEPIRSRLFNAVGITEQQFKFYLHGFGQMSRMKYNRMRVLVQSEKVNHGWF